MKHIAVAGVSALALATILAGQAAAQDVAEVVVTGSLIRGTPEDAALPVDVISSEDLAKQGSPTTVELIKNLPGSAGVLGDSNQFDGRSQGQEGIGTINLRGLGAPRTLVLFNGRRMPLTYGLYVDTNLLPTGAIGRVEVLKDGAAATYGSEAIGGVVNFIAPTTFEGLELDANYRWIKGSEGEWGGGLKWGWSNDRANAFVAMDFSHRSKLPLLKRDYASRRWRDNPEAGFSTLSTPIFYDNATGPASARFDPGCRTFAPQDITPSGTTCQYHLALADNLVEEEDRYSAFAQFNFDIDDDTTFHVDALYARGVVLMNTSSGFALLAGPTGSINGSPISPSNIPGRYFVPASNPGLIDFAAKNPTLFPAGPTDVAFLGYRPFAFDGNPLYGGRGAEGKRDYETWRVSADLRGKLPVGGIGYTASLTYGQNSSYLSQADTEIAKFQLALRGLGGPGCNPASGTPGVGPCMYFNPFSNSTERSFLTGIVNPQFTATSPRNSRDLVAWFFTEHSREQVNRTFVADLVFDGTIPGFELPGGEIGWAVGAQYRRNQTEDTVSSGWDAAINPCADTPITGNTGCNPQTGPLAFLGTFGEQDLEQDIKAYFAEVNVPITDAINVQAAARYEDYGGGINTFDPKVSGRWQITDAVAIRGSVGSTFRGPPASFSSGRITNLQFIAGNFRPVDVNGNPNLKPESALTYSVGAIFKAGGLLATIDYWSIDFKDPLVAEPFAAIVAAAFPTASGLGTACDSNSPRAALLPRFTFTPGAPCSSANIARVNTSYINGADQKTSGLDVLLTYNVPEPIYGVDLTVGGSLSYVFEYKVDAQEVDGFLAAPAFDAVNKVNIGQSVVPIVDWKAQAFAEFSRGPHNLRITANYISSYVDQRGNDIFGSNPLLVPAGSPPGTTASLLRGRKVKENLVFDAAYRVELPWETTLSVRVQNLFDQDPSYSRQGPGYDPFYGNPLGRTLRVGVTKKLW